MRQPREVDMVPEELRFVPQVKSDIIIQRRDVTLAPIEAANTYTRDGTNTITFNIQGHRELSQLLDTKSMYFTWHCAFDGGYPVEDVSMLIEEVIISSNGRTLERIRHAQYIQHFIRGYGMSRKSKARLGKRCGFQRLEDRTVQYYRDEDSRSYGNDAAGAMVPARVADAGPPPVAAVAATHNFFGYGNRKAPMTSTARKIDRDDALLGTFAKGMYGYLDYMDSTTSTTWSNRTRMSDNLGYRNTQVARQVGNGANGKAFNDGALIAGEGGYGLMKFRLPCSGLLSSDKMLPIGWMPLTIQLRLSDAARATDQGNIVGQFKYQIKRPRLHMNVCSVGQAYASAMAQRLRGPGLTLNCKMYDTFFSIISTDKQIVIPSNKQRLSKVYVMFHEGGADTSQNKNAFRSSVTGGPIYSMKAGDNVGGVDPYQSLANFGGSCLQSYQFQVGTEVSEAVTLEKSSGNLVPGADNVNSGMGFLEKYLRSIGAVNGHEQEKEFWGKDLEPILCNDHEGGDLLQTFLAKYFVAVYDGEKILGSNIETGVDTESGKDIVVDLRWAGGVPQGGLQHKVRVQALIQYHAQIVIKENDVSISF